MGNMFSPAPWWNNKEKKTGFTPGPMRVPVVNRKAPAPALSQPAPAPAPAPAPTPPGRVPAGKKGDCPICNRGFKRGGF